MHSLISGNKFLEGDGISFNTEKEEFVVNMKFKQDTIIASREWVKNNLDKVIKWSNNN